MDSNDYRKLLETAPALNVSTLEDKFKLLTDYGGAVLAGREANMTCYKCQLSKRTGKIAVACRLYFKR